MYFPEHFISSILICAGFAPQLVLVTNISALQETVETLEQIQTNLTTQLSLKEGKSTTVRNCWRGEDMSVIFSMSSLSVRNQLPCLDRYDNPIIDYRTHVLLQTHNQLTNYFCGSIFLSKKLHSAFLNSKLKL